MKINRWQKIKKPLMGFFIYIRNNQVSIYSSAGTGASTGHTSAQEPQSVQRSGLITYLSSPSLMASTGHSSTHTPQLIHSSVMT
jgi:hypothetical protein